MNSGQRMAAAGAACAIGLAGSASADLVGVVEARSITARTTVNGESDGPRSDAASGFADFDSGVTAGVATPGAAAGSAASQVSRFDADRFVGLGSASVSASGSGMIDTRAASVIDLAFGVDRTTDVTLIASVSGTGTIELREDGGALLFSGSGVFNTDLLGDRRYRLTATAGGALTASGAEGGGFSLQLIGVPSPGTVALVGAGGFVAARRRR